MKKNIFIFVLLIMIGIKSYSQGVWDKVEVVTDKFHNPQIRSQSVYSNRFNCYACMRHQIEANEALVMPS